MTTPHEGPYDLSDTGREDPGPADDRPLTYDEAEATYRGRLLTAGRDRYEELTDRELWTRTAALLRERGELDPSNPGHQAMAARQPLSAAEHLELMAIGEMLARYYRHPALLDHAAKAGATWEQIGAARGTSAEQAREDYREWAEGQHRLLAWTEGRIGMSDAEYGEAMRRLGEPAATPAGNPFGGKILCAHADQDGHGMHWKMPGEACTAAERSAGLEAGQ